MAKSRRRRQPQPNARTVSRSGDPRRRALAATVNAHTDPVERAAARIAATVAGLDPSDPMQVPSLPPLFVDVVAAEYLLPAERCLDDCMALAHAYAQLGIPAQVRAAELTVTDRSAKTSITYGTLAPRWENGMIHGHTVVWLPTLRCLVDVTAEQFPQIAVLDGGPVIIVCGPDDGAAGRIQTRRRNTLLAYALAPPETTAALLEHPVPRAAADDYRRRGLNIASAVMTIVAESLPHDSIGLIPHRRAAALIEAIRPLPQHETSAGDRCFLLPGANGTPTVARLDQIPLPAGTPAAAAFPVGPSSR
ncbi:hypothetical protein PS9374_04481 [Planomonospora sphaerica]|uniref:Uncharacterized protein n=1 Tax=Planomonospora sphaerica TaxID=161355 RepID=A0A171DIW6_9ACTN|nr:MULTISPECIES: hypothetical protein [Planomonospora]GAT68816.1 hypothetical protein PS9374_04481 [Planomonospora sphaerica]GGL40949.1 hypothetical protein GCM10014719_47750 [Planomonospora parontospora subsp. antibiotica]GII17904.1 hypothetical protein Ppa05_46300 [Planomonospora parontospora subsp. antibiotica]